MSESNHGIDIWQSRHPREIWILYAYQNPKNQAEARAHIYNISGIELNEGRHLIPITRQLREEGLVKWINPDTPPCRGKIHHTTEKGNAVIRDWIAQQTYIYNRFSMGS